MSLEALNGIKNTTGFIVLQGYVVNIGYQCIINSPRAGIYPVKFKNNRLPDDVKLGAYVTIIGKLITLDLGRAFVIIGAETLKPGSLPRFKKFLEGEKRNAENNINR